LLVSDLFKQILSRADTPGGGVFSADEVREWPDGTLDQFVSLGVLRGIAPANSVVCDQCEKACWIEPEIRDDPRTGKPVGIFFCKSNKDIGRFEVDLARLRQWQVNMPGLARSIAEGLSATGGVEESAGGRLYLLGRVVLQGMSREVFLAGGLSGPEARGVLSERDRREWKSAVVLVAGSVPRNGPWKKAGVKVFALRDVASFGPTGLIVSVSGLESLLAAKGSQRKSAKRKAKLLTEKAAVISFLLKHHGFESDEFRFEYAAQKEIGLSLGWRQPKVSRVIKAAMGPDFMKRYRAACRGKALRGFLKILDDGSAALEVPTFRPMHPTEKEASRQQNV